MEQKSVFYSFLILVLTKILYSNTVDEFAKISSVNFEVGGNVFLRNYLQQVSTSIYKSSKSVLHAKGHKLMLSLNDTIKKCFCDFTEKCFNFSVLHHELIVLLI